MHALKNTLWITCRRFCVACTVFILCSSCTSTAPVKKIPQWVIDPSTAYPDNQYVTGVGYALSRNDAEAAAVAVLTKSINQKVEAHSSSVQAMETGKERVSRSFSSSVSTFSAVDEIAGLHIREVWTAPGGEVYALALINREEVGSYYEQRVKNGESGINASIAFAADNNASFEGIAALRKAVRDAAENDKLLSILAVVHPLKYKNLSLAYKNTQTVQALLFRETEKIHIAVTVENDTDNRIKSAFSEVFKDAGFKTISENASDSADVPYVLTAVWSMQPIEVSGSSENKYVRYILKADLTDSRSGKTVLPWISNGREAHFTQSEAEQRALRSVETDIKKQFASLVFKIGVDVP